ncbi:MAG: hypothetical protein ACETWG_04610 [Candidatus Neomarinimicrobiota bacterium]
MYEIDPESEEFSRSILEAGNDPEFENEWVPAYKFEENAAKDLGIEVSDREKNYRDPPDYYFTADGQRIGMEITSLLDDEIMERNAFCQRVEGIIKKLIDDKKSVLPAGKYEIHFFPGEMMDVIEGVKMDIPVWGREFKGKEYEPQISSSLENLVRGFQGRHTTSEVKNKRGELIGTIHLSRVADCDEVDVFIWPQGVYLIKDWTPEEFQKALQGRVDAKEPKCEQAGLSLPHWLLISDTRSAMSTGGIEFDISSIKVKSSCFQRVFFIRGLETDYRISEVQCGRE